MRIAQSVVMFSILVLVCKAGFAGQQALLDRVQAAYQAFIAVERDFQRQREEGRLAAAEVADYADYVARLRERLSEDCLLLARAEIPLPEGVVCPENISSGPHAGIIDHPGEQTTAEKTATMDAELSSSLSEFDEMLLREQERVKADAPRSEVGGSGAAGGAREGQYQGDAAQGSAAADGGGESDELAGSADQTSDGAQGGVPPTGAAGGDGTGSPAGGRRADIPDGSDDDLVARQLREAAEKEKNPELKKKLWDEYRKYKLGTR
jgi:hypothetical protein